MIIAVVVLAAAGFAAVLFLWTSEERVIVPELVGLEEAEARGVVTGLGLELGEVDRVAVDAATAEPDTVVSQLPSAGSEVDSGTEVALVVAEAQEEPLPE